MDRRYDIDWLRIAAVLLLIPYHTARVFNWEEDFYVKNDPTSDAAQWFVDFVGNWQMSLLFLLAGAASWLAFRHRSGLQYAGERTKRLFIPFVFAVLVIVPPQSWLGYRWHDKGDPSYWAYLPTFFTTADDELSGYQGGFTPGHMWFVLALFGFAFLALPLFLWMRNGGGGRIVSALARAAQIPGLLIVIPALVLVLPWYVMRDDLSGQPPIGFFVVVLLGFVLMADERIGRVIDREWIWMLCLGVAASIAYIWAAPRAGELWDTSMGYAGMKFFYEVGVWCVMLGLLGLGHRFLTLGGPVWRYATEAAYPFYILHQTVIVAVAYVVCAWDWPVAVKMAAVAAVSLSLTLAVYELAVRRWRPVRFLFGMKTRVKVAPAHPAAPAPPAPVEGPAAPTSLPV